MAHSRHFAMAFVKAESQIFILHFCPCIEPYFNNEWTKKEKSTVSAKFLNISGQLNIFPLKFTTLIFFSVYVMGFAWGSMLA